MNFGGILKKSFTVVALAALFEVSLGSSCVTATTLDDLSAGAATLVTQAIDKIKNSLKRNLVNLCEFRGPRNSGGYYLKN